MILCLFYLLYDSVDHTNFIIKKIEEKLQLCIIPYKFYSILILKYFYFLSK